MSKFIINNNILENHQNQNAYYNRYQTVESTGILPINNSNIRYNNTLFDQNLNSVVHKVGNLTSNNNTRSISITYTPQSIRDFTYNILTNKFDENYPITNSYNLCDQKISIVFQAGNTHWTRFSNSLLSYPVNHQLTRVNTSDHKLDCSVKPPKPPSRPDECDLTSDITYLVENSIRKVRVIVSTIPKPCLLLQIKFFDDMSTPLSDWINVQSINSLQSDIEIPFFSDDASKAIVRLYSCQYLY